MNRENHTSTIGKDYGPIVGVAIIYDGVTYKLPKPNRHHNIIRMIAEINGKGIAGTDIQGFYDTDGIFHNRRRALKIAQKHNQLITKPHNNELFSEDLW